MTNKATPEMTTIYRAALDVALSARTDAVGSTASEIAIKREAYDSLVAAIREVDRALGFSSAV